MPDLKFGTTDVAAIKLGTTTVSKVMFGTTEIWPGAPSGWTNFAVIASTNTETGTSLGTANPIPAPAGVVAGNLLVTFCSHDINTPAVTASTGWTQIAQAASSTVHQLAAFGRVADGGANDTPALTGATQDYCASILRITGHSVTSVAADIKVATFNPTGGFINPDPPSLNAGSSNKWLWIAAVAVDTNAAYTITALPPSYSATHANLQSATGASGSALATAQRNLQTQTEDPGVFTNANVRPWVTFTLAIPGS